MKMQFFPHPNFDIMLSCMKISDSKNNTKTHPNADRLMTREEVAEYLNIGTTFIESLRRKGKLPSFKLSPKCVRYRKSDCDTLLERSLIARVR